MDPGKILGVHDSVFLDDPVLEENPGSKSVGFVRGERAVAQSARR